MRLSLEALERVQRSRNFRSLALIGVGVPGAVFAIFWALLGVLMFFFGSDADSSPWEHRSAAAVVFLFGLTPFAIFAFMTWRGVVGQLRLRRLRDLFAVVHEVPGLSASQIAQRLRSPVATVTSTLLAAKTLGLARELDEEGLWPEGVTPAAAPAVVAPDGSFVGSVFGSYRVERLIGSGAMGDVYAAHHVRTGRAYAIKVLRRELRPSGDALKRFEREALAASRLGHPGIIAVHDYDRTEDGAAYLVMDLLEGETLASRLAREATIPWDEARGIALEIADALAAAHAQRLVHRDLKPANVFLCVERDGARRTVVLDFGLVKPLDEAGQSRVTKTGASVGTPMYMAPEQARGETEDERADVYALGAVLYEMVSGAPPFMDQTLASVYARLLTEPAPSLKSVLGDRCPEGLDAFVDRALAKRAEDRFASMVDLRRALEGLGPGRRGAGLKSA